LGGLRLAYLMTTIFPNTKVEEPQAESALFL
jgi:hypothetical protein